MKECTRFWILCFTPFEDKSSGKGFLIRARAKANQRNHKPLDHALPLGETSYGMLSPSSSARKSMQIGPTTILDTFAEAFRMRYARLLVTAHDDYWLQEAVRAATGYASSIIACDADAGLERLGPAEATPDGRPGAPLLMLGCSGETRGPGGANR